MIRHFVPYHTLVSMYNCFAVLLFLIYDTAFAEKVSYEACENVVEVRKTENEESLFLMCGMCF